MSARWSGARPSLATALHHIWPRSVAAQFGLLVIIIFSFITLFAPQLATHGESEIVGRPFQPFGTFVLGTDNLGRDVLSRMIYAARNTIGVALIINCTSFVLGGMAGFLSVIFRGWVDQTLSRIVDIVMAIPMLIFALLLLTIVGTSIPALIGVIAVLDSTRVFRLVRAAGLDVATRDFFEFAVLRGEGVVWLIGYELLPNIWSTILAEFGLRFCFVFLLISALSFLGLGIQPPHADWASMVRESANLLAFGDLTPFLPAGAIALLTIGVNFFVDGFIDRQSRPGGQDA